jgi:hypothetical protein
MTESWATMRAADVRPGDRVRLASGQEILVSRIEPNFMGMDAVVALIEDTPTRWFKQPVPRPPRSRSSGRLEILQGGTATELPHRRQQCGFIYRRQRAHGSDRHLLRPVHTAATIIRQLTGTFGPLWYWLLPLSGRGVAAATVSCGLYVFAANHTNQGYVAGHNVTGIGLIAACVSTVATTSRHFVLIPRNSHGAAADGPPPGAPGRPVGLALTAIPSRALLSPTGVGLLYPHWQRHGELRPSQPQD